YPPHGDLGVPVRALVSVDASRAVEFIRARLATSKTPGILLRNLQAADDPKALDLALEVAAKTDDADLLTEVARVLSGPAALDSLARREVRHGPLADLLVPLVRDAKRTDGSRLLALRALATDADAVRQAESMLWDIASDRAEEDDDLRREAAHLLEGVAGP